MDETCAPPPPRPQQAESRPAPPPDDTLTKPALARRRPPEARAATPAPALQEPARLLGAAALGCLGADGPRGTKVVRPLVARALHCSGLLPALWAREERGREERGLARTVGAAWVPAEEGLLHGLRARVATPG